MEHFFSRHVARVVIVIRHAHSLHFCYSSRVGSNNRSRALGFVVSIFWCKWLELEMDILGHSKVIIHRVLRKSNLVEPSLT